MNAREPAVASIGCHPFAPRLDRQRSEPSILNHVAGDSCVLAQFNEDRPMALAWAHKEAGIRLHEGLAECDGVLGPARLKVNTRMGADANQPGEYLGCNAIRAIAVDGILQPAVIVGVTGRIFTRGVQQDVYIRENHSRPSSKSSNAAESSRLTPGRVPLLECETGRRICFPGPRREGRASTRRSPRSDQGRERFPAARCLLRTCTSKLSKMLRIQKKGQPLQRAIDLSRSDARQPERGKPLTLTKL